MQTIYKFKKPTIILLVFIALGVGLQLGVAFSKAIGLAFELAKWQKAIWLGSLALFLLLPIFRKAMYLIAVNAEKDFVISNLVAMVLHCALLGFAFYLVFTSVVFLLLYFLTSG